MVISCDMTMSVRFCLSYDPLKWDFIAFKVNIISTRKRIVDTGVVNDNVNYVYAPKCYYKCGLRNNFSLPVNYR